MKPGYSGVLRCPRGTVFCPRRRGAARSRVGEPAGEGFSPLRSSPRPLWFLPRYTLASLRECVCWWFEGFGFVVELAFVGASFVSVGGGGAVGVFGWGVVCVFWVCVCVAVGCFCCFCSWALNRPNGFLCAVLDLGCLSRGDCRMSKV